MNQIYKVDKPTRWKTHWISLTRLNIALRESKFKLGIGSITLEKDFQKFNAKRHYWYEIRLSFLLHKLMECLVWF